VTYGPLLNGASVLVFEGVGAELFLDDVLLTVTCYLGLLLNCSMSNLSS
jgi:hypothetical protein